MHDLFRDWLVVGIDAGLITVGRAAEIAGERLEDWRRNTRQVEGAAALERVVEEWRRWDHEMGRQYDGDHND
jgi:hypothetical protein